MKDWKSRSRSKKGVLRGFPVVGGRLCAEDMTPSRKADDVDIENNGRSPDRKADFVGDESSTGELSLAAAPAPKTVESVAFLAMTSRWGHSGRHAASPAA